MVVVIGYGLDGFGFFSRAFWNVWSERASILMIILQEYSPCRLEKVLLTEGRLLICDGRISGREKGIVSRLYANLGWSVRRSGYRNES